MKTFEITIEGTTPLLCNRFTDEKTTGNGGSGVYQNDRGTPREQAEIKLYRGADDKTLVIPQPNIFSCIICAGKYFKAGRTKITTMKSSLIPACVEIEGIAIPIEHNEPWSVDSRPVRSPATGGRMMCHRPSFEDWKLSFVATLDEEIISAKLFREVVDAAGKRVGLGDFRPDCKGPFGKFVVTRWEIQRDALKEVA